MSLRLHRVRPGFYVTEDNLWEVVQDPFDGSRGGWLARHRSDHRWVGEIRGTRAAAVAELQSMLEAFGGGGFRGLTPPRGYHVSKASRQNAILSVGLLPPAYIWDNREAADWFAGFQDDGEPRLVWSVDLEGLILTPDPETAEDSEWAGYMPPAAIGAGWVSGERVAPGRLRVEGRGLRGLAGAACPAGLESRELTALHAGLLGAPPLEHTERELAGLVQAAMGPLVRFYMRRGLKVCSGIAPAFVALAHAAGFQAEARDSGRHVTALVSLDDGSVYRVDPSAVQFHPDLLRAQDQGFFEGDPEFDDVVWALVERVQADPMFAVAVERVR